MYSSSYDAATNKRLVQQAELCVIDAHSETADEDGLPTTFLWVVARKPGVPNAAAVIDS
jgi:hypothetical protein